jgi:hypothetical protein
MLGPVQRVKTRSYLDVGLDEEPSHGLEDAAVVKSRKLFDFVIHNMDE